MGKEYGPVTILLIVLLTVRSVSQFFFGILSGDILAYMTYYAFGVVYLAALFGVSLRRGWGSVLVMVMGTIDVLFAFFMGGFPGLAAGFVDLLIILLGYKEHGRVTRKPFWKRWNL